MNNTAVPFTVLAVVGGVCAMVLVTIAIVPRRTRVAAPAVLSEGPEPSSKLNVPKSLRKTLSGKIERVL